VLLSRIDPTLKNQVGNDRGTQYRHGIYFHSPEQEATAKAALEKEQGKYGRPIVTECMPAAVYWPAEEYHQSACSYKLDVLVVTWT
jgi:peptide-methionine (S)-S-oxide reductase